MQSLLNATIILNDTYNNIIECMHSYNNNNETQAISLEGHTIRDISLLLETYWRHIHNIPIKKHILETYT